MKQPNWKDAPEWANWVAMDESEIWYWFENKPKVYMNMWEEMQGRHIPVIQDWKDTLQKRPEED